MTETYTPDGSKACNKCRAVKPLDDFPRHKNRPDGRHSWCRVCHRQSVRDSANRNPERIRDAWRKAKYGLVPGDYEAMAAAQGGLCAVCGGAPQRALLCVDHDHATGRIRGLLCDPCNTGIGHLRDSPELLTRAIAYLETA